MDAIFLFIFRILLNIVHVLLPIIVKSKRNIYGDIISFPYVDHLKLLERKGLSINFIAG